MLDKKPIFTIVGRILLTVTLFLFLGACSQNTDPLTSEAASGMTGDNEASGISDLTFISMPESAGSMEKLVSDAEMIYWNQGGELSVSSGQDFELIELIKKAPYQITTYDAAQVLLNASPLSAKVLESICENTNVRDDYWMVQVLLRNAPLRKNVLDKIIENHFIIQTYWLKEVLVASSPLPQSIMSKIYQIYMLPSERNEVFAAQVGQRLDEYSYNNAGGGLKIDLEIKPYAITQNTYICMVTDDAYLMGSIFMTFGPHGIQFNPPALLDYKISGLNLTGINPDLVNIYYVNSETGLWEVLPSKNIVVDTEAGYIEIEDAEFLHFSRYAIGMR